MEIIIDVVIVKGFKNIEYFQAKTNEKTYILHRKVLEREFKKLVMILNELKNQGIIKNPKRD